MARVLVVEDEADLQAVLAFNLREAGHSVQVVGDLAQARISIAQQRPELVLLDLMLPDGSGMELCRRLLAETHLPHVGVLIITAKDSEIDRVVGFELGADDYVCKPFSLRELMLRVEALLRRLQGPVAVRQRQMFGQLALDQAAHRCWVTEIEVELTAVEFRLLAVLFARRDRVQSRQALLDAVWPNHDIDERTVDVHVKRLREKLGIAGSYLETVRSVGYRFIGQLPTAADPNGSV